MKDIYISKIKGKKVNSLNELEDYLFLNSLEETDICHWYRQRWLAEWFESCEFKEGHYDEFILSKRDIIKFKDYCERLLNEGWDKFYNEVDIFSCGKFKETTTEEIINEIKNTLIQINTLLKEDFENNTYKYYTL